MTWTLVIVTLHGAGRWQQPDLWRCGVNGIEAVQRVVEPVREAYCRSPAGRVVWIVKDGQTLP